MRHKKPAQLNLQDLDHIDTSGLPTGLRSMIQYLGLHDAGIVVKELGGQQITVPRTVTAEHALCATLGPRVFAKLVACYGGELLAIHKADSILRQLTYRQVHHVLKSGTYNEAAKASGYTSRHCINIGKMVLRDERQGDLF